MLSLLLLTLAPRALAAENYIWVAKEGVAEGCVALTDLRIYADGKCEELPFAPSSCLKPEAETKILPPGRCAAELRTVFNWLDPNGESCAEFALIEDHPDQPKLYLKPARREQCTHQWVEPREQLGECNFVRGGAHFFHPLNQVTLEKLVPEILSLAIGDAVPPQLYDKASPRELALSLVHRVHQKRDAKKTLDAHDFLENGEVQIAFDSKLLPSILAKGFLNQHQTGTTKGAPALELRRRTENELAGLDLGKEDVGKNGKINLLRPKYAFFLPHGNSTERKEMKHDYWEGYGNVVASLSPKTMDRVTFTVRDSLSFADFGHLKGMFEAGTAKRAEKPTLQRDFAEYWEAQVWGDLTVQEDVAHFLVGCFTPAPGETDADRSKLVAELKKTGKPVYQCSTDRLHSESGKPITSRLRRGEPL